MDNLQLSHIPYCQPGLPKNKTGFLKDYRYPKQNVEDFKMILRIIGEAGMLRRYKAMREDTSIPFLRPIADVDEPISSKFENKMFSQESFGEFHCSNQCNNGTPTPADIVKASEEITPSLEQSPPSFKQMKP